MTPFVPRGRWLRLSLAAVACASVIVAHAAPTISRLTPPSELFASGNPNPPYIARFVTGQRFDLQATVRPAMGTTIAKVEFAVDGRFLAESPRSVLPGVGFLTDDPACYSTARPANCKLVAGLPPGTAVASFRAYSNDHAGVHTLAVTATDNAGAATTATGNFEIVDLPAGGDRAKNIIIMLGDGMGASHRTAARIVLNGYAQGKARQKLAMDTFPHTAMIMTASLNSIVTDSAPGMQNYVTGNKSSNNQEGVWPDDTLNAFDNPRVEYLGEYLARLQGRKLGIVTTADVFDATPASMAVHTSNRGAGTGIVDQYLDEATHASNLTVLLGGGRKWFLPATVAGSGRGDSSDYVLPRDVAAGWGVPAGTLDKSRDVIADFKTAGWSYASDRTTLNAAGVPSKLLGLFALSNMNIALDKIDGRRGKTSVVADYGFPDQPMLDEMTQKALEVLDANSPHGFLLMVEGASIDKQSHQMDSERWIGEMIEFDRSVAVAKTYAEGHPDTLVIVTADHECGGAVIIGASTVTDAVLQATTGTAGLQGVVGTYDAAHFPRYPISPTDGYPTTYDPDFKLLIGYGANGDRYEDWRTNVRPVHDTQQPFDAATPLSTYPRINASDTSAGGKRPLRDEASGFLITGHVAGDQGVHTGGDIPLSAFGRGAALFAGTLDNTDVFFRMMQVAVGGAR